MRGLLPSLGILIVAVLVLWLLGRLFGFQVSLVWSLVASVVLTVVLNLILSLFRRR